MARVPKRTAPQIQLQPRTEAKFFASDPPPSMGEALWDFGTALGRASQVPERRQREPEPQTVDRDETAVSVGDTALMRDVAALLYSGDKAYMSRTGEAAVVGREDAVRQIKDAIARNRANMPSLAARDTYDDITNRRQKDWFAEIDRHAAAQQEVAIGEQSLARQRALTGIATGTSSDEERLKNILTIEGEIFKRGMRQGRPLAEIESDRFGAVTDVHAGVVRSLIDADDAPRARAYLNANTDAIADAAERELRAALRMPLARAQANDDVDHAIGAGTRDPATLTFSYDDPVHGAGKRPAATGSGGWSAPAPAGVAVYPIAPGVATLSDDGHGISVTHDDGSVSHYAGLGSQDVADGARVMPDTVIGAIGAAATSDGSPFSGAALHYRVERDGVPIENDEADPARARIHREAAMAAINLRADREDWGEDRRIEALREVDRRVRREERSIADAQTGARDAALTIAEGLGRGFTDIAQIPPKILAALELDDLRRITARADANENPVPVAEAGDTAARLNLLAVHEGSGFAKADLRLFHHEMTEGQYAALSNMQTRIRANPDDPTVATVRRIWGLVGGEMSNLTTAVVGAAQTALLKLYTTIKRETDRVTEGKRQPTAREIEQAYDNAVIATRTSGDAIWTTEGDDGHRAVGNVDFLNPSYQDNEKSHDRMNHYTSTKSQESLSNSDTLPTDLPPAASTPVLSTTGVVGTEIIVAANIPTNRLARLNSGLTVESTPAMRAAAEAALGRYAVPVGENKLVGFGYVDPGDKIAVADPSRARYGETGDTISGGAETATVRPEPGRIVAFLIHGHIDRYKRKRQGIGASQYLPESDGMVDHPEGRTRFGDAQSLSLERPYPTATVSHGRIGWHEIKNGQLIFRAPVGTLSDRQIRSIQNNLDRQQRLFYVAKRRK